MLIESLDAGGRAMLEDLLCGQIGYLRILGA